MISVYDLLARTLYDDERGIEYPALTCMNNDDIANRIKVDGAEPRIYVISASQKLNSDIAIDFRRILSEKKLDLLVSYETATEEILPNINEYMNSPDADTQMFYESPFLEIQALISETSSLVYEKKEQTGMVVVHESGAARKDRYSSCSYASWLASLFERDLVANDDDYEFAVFIN